MAKYAVLNHSLSKQKYRYSTVKKRCNNMTAIFTGMFLAYSLEDNLEFELFIDIGLPTTTNPD